MDNFDRRLKKLEYKYKQIEWFVMESKQFEKIVIWSLAIFYVYMGFNIGLWIFRMVLG